MRSEYFQLTVLLGAIIVSAVLAGAEPPRNNESSATPAAAAVTPEQADTMRLEGEKRFRANCGRCHMAPHKYSPRVMATAVRHMRVRATITEEDMRYIRYFLTQ